MANLFDLNTTITDEECCRNQKIFVNFISA